MYRLNQGEFRTALRSKGYNSVEALAKQLAIHRNTVNHYLRGRSVLPEALTRILDALDLSPANAFEQIKPKSLPYEPVASFVDQVASTFPHVTLVMFGSRVSGKAKRYSDFDIGVFFADKNQRDAFRQILRMKLQFEDSSPWTLDLVDLALADDDFLRNIAVNWTFIGGSLKGWITLQKRVANEK